MAGDTTELMKSLCLETSTSGAKTGGLTLHVR